MPTSLILSRGGSGSIVRAQIPIIEGEYAESGLTCPRWSEDTKRGCEQEGIWWCLSAWALIRSIRIHWNQGILESQRTAALGLLSAPLPKKWCISLLRSV